MKKAFFFFLLTINLFSCSLFNKMKISKKNDKKDNFIVNKYTNSSFQEETLPQKKVTLKEIIKWDLNRYCPSYILTGKLIADYYSPKKNQKKHFSGSIYIQHLPKNFKIHIYDKYNQKVFEKTIKSLSFALCIGENMCINVSGNDLLGYLDIQNLRNVKLIKNTLIGLKSDKIVVINYPKEAQIRDLGKIIKYYYNKDGKIRKIEIKIKRVGNIEIIVDKVLCKKN